MNKPAAPPSQLALLSACLAPPSRHALMVCAREALPLLGAEGTGAKQIERLAELVWDLAAEDEAGGQAQVTYTQMNNMALVKSTTTK